MENTGASAYPLSWPGHIPRMKTREAGRFSTTLAKALDNVRGSLRKFSEDSGKKLDGVVISSNYSLGISRPPDPGVAVWFVWDALQVCIPVDRYTTVEANLQAIHHVLEARRTELRHGTLALVRASFQGFKALPAPAGKGWRDILALPSDVQPTREVVQAAYRQLAAVRHPDTGGSEAAMAELNTARDAALQELAR